MECVAYYILLLRVHDKGVSRLYPYVEIKMPSIKKIKNENLLNSIFFQL